MKSNKKFDIEIINPSTYDTLSVHDFDMSIEKAMCHAVLNGAKVDVKQTRQKTSNTTNGITLHSAGITIGRKKEESEFVEQVFRMHD